MSDVVNLRRARKAKARDEKDREAEASRVRHGVAKPERDLAKARTDKMARGLEARRLDGDEK